MTKEIVLTEEEMMSQNYINEYVKRGRSAQQLFEEMTQEQVDRAVMAAGRAVHENALKLAEMAVEETGMGNVEDKTIKNTNKAEIIWHSLKGKKSRGILDRDLLTGITTVAKPVGVIAAITPCTNPIVTPMSNVMFALKSGNAIIITPHHKSIKCSTYAVELMQAAIKAVGAPDNLVQILGEQSRDNTRNLIAACDVVIATGGMGMVKAAYSSGRPALGVGAGNVQCIIDKDVDYKEAISKIIKGRIFDNGIICSGEQSVIYPRDHREKILEVFREEEALLIDDPRDKEALRKTIFPDGSMSRHAVGQSAEVVGKMAGLDVPKGCKVIVVEGDGYGPDELLSKEKMCPVLVINGYDDFHQAVEIAKANLEVEGKGHTVAIHSDNIKNIEYAAETLSASRFVVNQISSFNAGGSYYNGLNPTNTLGCGTWGNNSISENLTYTHLMNVSRIAQYMPENRVPSLDELWTL
ncbi:MAG: aldehyde dehydrogenase family protein [Anaerovoracaceae bacterium]|jgi:succinate-semialdehyde dehydrogenase|nr:aldehyde dehydrogenase family protein [Anaerovoracaceae bacterium]